MLIVQKYGGTSVGSVARIHAVAAQVRALRGQGHQVAVVVHREDVGGGEDAAQEKGAEQRPEQAQFLAIRHDKAGGLAAIPVDELSELDPDIRHDAGHMRGPDPGTRDLGDDRVLEPHDEA